VLDDWQEVAHACADWSPLAERTADITFLNRAFASEEEAAQTLAPYEILVTLRERTAFPASLLERLPRLRMIAVTGAAHRTLDMDACTTRGIVVCNTGGASAGAATAELTLALLLAATRPLIAGDAAIRAGRFQEGVPLGTALTGKTLGIIGLGRIGTQVARWAHALDMTVLAWSQNLTEAQAEQAGAKRVDKETLLRESDAVTLHLVLSERTRGIISADDLAKMKSGAVLVNTSRGPLVDEAVLLDALHAGRITAALDVYDREPLPPDHPLRTAPNTVLAPHLGYNTRELFAQFYRESVENIVAFLDGAPRRVLNPDALARTSGEVTSP
jgi:phosphoglycerate dehydrogenase-like enzyme